MDFFQKSGIVHRDLKPENILLDSDFEEEVDLRIADFGFAVY